MRIESELPNRTKQAHNRKIKLRTKAFSHALCREDHALIVSDQIFLLPLAATDSSHRVIGPPQSPKRKPHAAPTSLPTRFSAPPIPDHRSQSLRTRSTRSTTVS